MYVKNVFILLYDNEDEYNEIRIQIYNYAKNNKEEIKHFFLEDSVDDVIVNTKIDNYIEEIKKNKFYGETIELGIFANLNNNNISVYTINQDDDNEYTHFTNIRKDENINKFL